MLPLPSAASCRRSSPAPCAATPICFRDAIFPGAAARCNSWSSLSASSTAHLRCPGAPKSIPLEEPVMLDPALPLAPLRLQRHTRHMVMPWKASEVVKYPRPAGPRPGSVSWGWHLHCAHLCRCLRMARRHLMQLRSNSNRQEVSPCVTWTFHRNLNPLDAARFIIGIRWSGDKYFPAWPWFTFVFLQNWVLTIKSLIFYGVKVPKYVLRIISSSKLMAGNLFHMQVFNFIIYVRDNIFLKKKNSYICFFLTSIVYTTNGICNRHVRYVWMLSL